MIRMLSNFSVKNGAGDLRQVPITYGDMTRQVGSIIRENSENKLPSAPRMALYMTALEPDRSETRDSSFVDKVQVRERAFDEEGKEYLNYQGKNYTVERLMPTPYKLTVNADIWTTNTDQKLQLLEQILMLFNPSIEIQTTDNYIDHTSLTTVMLDGITLSSRTIPMGTDSDIDVATLTFSTPIWISPPVKVKRLGVITNIIASIFDESKGNIDMDLSIPELSRWNDVPEATKYDADGNATTETSNTKIVVATNYLDLDILVDGDIIKIHRGSQAMNWISVLDAEPGIYQEDISRIFIKPKIDDEYMSITGTFTVNPIDNTQLLVNWDEDTFPNDTIITSATRDVAAQTTIDYIIDPQKTSPSTLKTIGARILLINNIGSNVNTDGADAWKNTDTTDFVAGVNDIVEWSGSAWSIVFDASNNVYSTEYVYTTNLKTGIQYRWDGTEWLLSVDGPYPKGTWRINLHG